MVNAGLAAASNDRRSFALFQMKGWVSGNDE